MEQGEKPELELLRSLDQLKSVPPRDPNVTARGRAQFLAQAETLRSAVSAEPFWRQIGWKNIFPQKEVRVPTLIALVLAFAVALGGSGAVAVAVQDAMPNDPLYPVKLWTEEVQVNLTFDPETRANLLLDLANRRATEVTLPTLTTPLVEQTIAREQVQVQTALQLAAQLEETAMTRLLMRAQTQLEQQTRAIESVSLAAQIKTQLREMLATQQALIQLGLQNRNEFRQRILAGKDKLPPPTTWPPVTLPVTVTVRPHPTDFLPTVLATRTITRPTDIPRPTIPPTLTIPAHPTIVHPTIPVTLAVPTCIPWPPNWPTPSVPTSTVPLCPWPTDWPTPPIVPPTRTVMPLPTHWQTPPAKPTIVFPTPPSNWTPPAPPPDWTPPAPPKPNWTPPPMPTRRP